MENQQLKDEIRVNIETLNNLTKKDPLIILGILKKGKGHLTSLKGRENEIKAMIIALMNEDIQVRNIVLDAVKHYKKINTIINL